VFNLEDKGLELKTKLKDVVRRGELVCVFLSSPLDWFRPRLRDITVAA
jgi:hypothetical protein